ncbi:hypothetical protein M3Y96_00465900 [Aphelenchoides besseyi]|nr:hypothetical protein M3Y96_00465900 [Aphelenchoides besseyi]
MTIRSSCLRSTTISGSFLFDRGAHITFKIPQMSEVGRKSTIGAVIVLTIIGIGLSIGAILTPSWQVVNLREYNSIHEHGLWLDCTRHTRDGNVLLRRYATYSEPLHCVYKFDYDKYSGTFNLEDDNSPVGEVNRHKFYGWHTATLILLALALLTAFLSVCVGLCGCCYPSLALVLTVITLLTTFLSSIAVGLFFFFSHRADNRFIKGIVGTYEQRVGLAFFLEMAACFFHFIAFLVAMLSTYFSFSGKGTILERYSVPHSSHTNMTNVGRGQKEWEVSSFAEAPLLMPMNSPAPPSFHTAQHQQQYLSMEFDQPVFTTNTTPNHMKQIRPVFYKTSNDDVAHSMPEVQRSYQDVSGGFGRIRRKSETCCLLRLVYLLQDTEKRSLLGPLRRNEVVNFLRLNHRSTVQRKGPRVRKWESRNRNGIFFNVLPFSSPSSGGSMGCSKRAVWLSAFMTIQVLGFTACLIAVATPTWQYVYLEDGRTEHHHGLWLDCKRDYSDQYGKSREYYETLYRLDHLQMPFDQFWLPKLMCVYKFDYWLDDEDWYEHGYDENRLQGDAYQHLFIGWKIAALTAHCFSCVCSMSAIIIMFCAFCHRLLICVSAVLVSLSVITAFIGNVVFYMFANYQDNNVIHEEDGDYEQYFGWSFYSALLGNVLLLISSIIGCLATSAVVSFGKAKLVKIEIAEQDRDQLLNSGHSSAMGSGPAGSRTTGSTPGFKRSMSAVYKIESAALKKWEREQMRQLQRNEAQRSAAFKRTNSMPNIVKKAGFPSQTIAGSKQFMMNSQSDISSRAVTEPVDILQMNSIQSRPFIPRPSPTATPQDEVVYEYVEPHSLSLVSDSYIDRRPALPKRPLGSVTALNVYDSVHESSGTNTPTRLTGQEGDNEYLKPRNYLTPESTTINAKSNESSTFSATPRAPLFTSTKMTRQQIEERFERSNLVGLCPKNLIAKEQPDLPTSAPPKPPPKPAIRSSLRALTRPTERPPTSPPLADEVLKLNTFQFRDANGRIRSLTNLTVPATVDDPSLVPSIGNFDHRSQSPTEIASSVAGSNASTSTYDRVRLLGEVPLPGLKETSFDARLYSRYAPSEADRSVGSGVTFRPVSPNYELDDQRSTATTSTSASAGSGFRTPTHLTGVSRTETNATQV